MGLSSAKAIGVSALSFATAAAHCEHFPSRHVVHEQNAQSSCRQSPHGLLFSGCESGAPAKNVAAKRDGDAAGEAMRLRVTRDVAESLLEGR